MKMKRIRKTYHNYWEFAQQTQENYLNLRYQFGYLEAGYYLRNIKGKKTRLKEKKLLRQQKKKKNKWRCKMEYKEKKKELLNKKERLEKNLKEMPSTKAKLKSTTVLHQGIKLPFRNIGEINATAKKKGKPYGFINLTKKLDTLMGYPQT